MSSSKTKHVHYERGTKSGTSHHRSTNSRDSGIGSSSASDRASLGEAPIESFTSQKINSQRCVLSAVREALDAANEKIGQLEDANGQLKALLAESKKENRTLRREREKLYVEIDGLIDVIGEEKKINKRLTHESSPRTSTSTRSSPPRAERTEPSRHRRASVYEAMPAVPQPPPNSHPNPFVPNPMAPASRGVPPIVTYSTLPSSVSYTPSALSYSSTPTFAHTSPRSPRFHRQQSSEDGRYHLTPV